jgi:hypothetical protein
MSITRSTPRRALASSLLLVLLSAGLLTTGLMRSADAKPQGNDGDVALNAANSEFSPTSVTNISNSGGYGFGGTATADPNGIGLVGNGSATGVKGTGGTIGLQGFGGGTGVEGWGASGANGFGVKGTAPVAGVRGVSDGAGVWGTGDTGVEGDGGSYGIEGRGDVGVSAEGNHTGVVATGHQGQGVEAYGEGGFGVRAGGDSGGVLGFSETEFGVWGNSGNDNGVFGESGGSSTSGVYGLNDSNGFGVAGRANNGTGVLADSQNGYALQAFGKIHLNRAGINTIPANRSYVQVALSGLQPGGTFVIATLQGHVSKVWVEGVVVNSTTQFTIYLSKAPTTAVQVAWFVLD